MRCKTHRILSRALHVLAALLTAIVLTSGCLTSGGSVKSPDPVLAVSATTLDFGQTAEKLTFTVSNTGGGEMEWRILPDGVPSWCRYDPGSGAPPAEVTVVVDRTELDPGNHTTVLTIRSNGGTKTVTVLMTVPERSATGAIIIDTPIPK